MIRLRALVLLALTSAGTLACSETVRGPYTPMTCEEVGSQIISLNTVGLTGFSAATILENVRGPTSLPMTYANGTTSTLTLQITYSEGVIAEVEQVRTEAGQNLLPEEPCMNHMRIEALVSLSSEDGLINLEEPMQLMAYAIDDIILSHEILSESLEALLEAASLTPSEQDRVRYYLDNRWVADTLGGEIMATIEPNGNSSQDTEPETIVSISMNTLATW